MMIVTIKDTLMIQLEKSNCRGHVFLKDMKVYINMIRGR